MTLKDQDQLVEDLKREYPAASQVPAAMKKAREVFRHLLEAMLSVEYGVELQPASFDRLLEELRMRNLGILPREPDEGLEALFHDKIRIMCDPENKSASVLNFPELYRAMVQHYESKGEAE